MRLGNEIAGVGAIKRSRPNYVSDKAKKSQFDFDRETLELGYVAVDKNHQGHRLSYCIVEALLSRYSGRLFATTDHDGMKKALEHAGFKQKGFEWQGKRGKLSLWLKE